MKLTAIFARNLRLCRQHRGLSQERQAVFAGLTEPETAEALGISERSVRRDWVQARDWMAANGA